MIIATFQLLSVVFHLACQSMQKLHLNAVCEVNLHPQKMKILAWKAASGALATNVCKKYRHISKRSTCPLCGREEESSYHALIACEHARELWERMRERWPLPNDSALIDTGNEWLLDLLASCGQFERDCIIMLVWRIWSLRTDSTHGKDVPTAQVSADYLQRYMLALDLSRRYNTEELMKGKMPAVEVRPEIVRKKAAKTLSWPPPPANRVALSVDGSFLGADGTAAAAAGMILRRHDGGVVFAAYRYIFNCNDALEAELHAIMQGMALALQHSEAPVIVQSDSSEALLALSGEGLSRSAYGHLVAEIKFLMEGREFIPMKIKREQNRVADRLASYSRVESSTAVWLRSAPPCIEDLLPLDCNPIMME